MPSQESVASSGADPGTAAPSAGISTLSSCDGAEESVQAPRWPDGSLGAYRLLEQIGSGGMGEVWLGEQTHPLHRRVAVKLIKAGMDTREVVARFQSERQALALMNHSSIAKVFEAGSTPQGRPYFVMEYITGTAITQYCDEHRTTVRQRLELFIQVCDAIQHAHQKAIIHRDLKPSNILVTEVEGKPVPQIIDFGIAKALSHGLIAETEVTPAGMILGTTSYMSPEQAESGGLNVDTRTGVYSLGVILYELLVGVRPLEFHQLAMEEMLRRLQEEEAPRPSTKLRTLSGRSAVIAEKRGSDLVTLTRQLHGDLDAIALKALEKDRSRRYASSSDFAADIGRYLRNEAVHAVPPSFLYRARKFARRYRVAVSTITAFVLVLLLAALVSIRQSIRASSEAATAQAISDFLQHDLLAQASAATQASPHVKPDPDLRVRTALDRAAARIEGRFDEQPEVEAAIRDTIGQTYMDLGLYPEGRTQLQRAMDLYRRTVGPENAKTIKAMRRLGWIAYLRGEYAQAEALLGQAIQISRRTLGPEHVDTLFSASYLANVYWAQGKYTQAEALHSHTLEIRRRVLGPEHRDTLSSMNNLGIVYATEGKYAQAEPLFSKALDIQRRLLGAEHPTTLDFMNNLAIVYEDEGKHVQAELLHRETLEIKRRVLGAMHDDTLDSMNNLANVYNSEGKYAQAETLYKETLEIKQRVLGSEHPATLVSMINLGDSYAAQGKYAQAGQLFSRTLETSRRVLGPEHPNTLFIISELASMYQRQGKYGLAETYAAQVLAQRRRVLGSAHPDTMASAADLALVYVSSRRFTESEPLAREVLDFDRINRPDDWQRFRDETLLGDSLAGQNKFREAERLLCEGYQGMVARKDRMQVSDWHYLTCARQWIIELYQQWGKPEKAAECRQVIAK